MKMKKPAAVAVSSVLLLSQFCLPVSAESWAILGTRPLGMGGAFVAVAHGNLAQYWNPAGLAQLDNVSGLQIPIGGRAELTGGVLRDANTLADLSSKYSGIKTAQTSGTAGAMDADKFAAFFEGLKSINSMNQPGKGALVNAEGGVNIKIKRFVLSVNNFTAVGAAPSIDVTNIGLGSATGVSGVSFTGTSTAVPIGTKLTARNTIDAALSATDWTNINNLTGGALAAAGITTKTLLANAIVNLAASNGISDAQITEAANKIAESAPGALPVIAAGAAGNPYTNNQTSLALKAGSFTEASLSYARNAYFKGFYVGGNLKAIAGRLAYQKFDVLSKEVDRSEVFDMSKKTKVSVQPSIDLGLLLDMKEQWGWWLHPRLGLVARNINSPKFKQPDIAVLNGAGDKYALKPQLRGGLAISPFRWWTIATDLDLTKNKTQLPGFESRLFSAGTEINIFNRSWINIPLRVGIMKNLADSESKSAYTAGIGLNFLHIIVDVGGALSSEKVVLDTSKSGGKAEEVFANVGVAGQIAFLF